MRLPTELLACVRGPIAIAAIVGCSAPAVTPVAPEPPVVQAPLPPPDPVAYDVVAEAARLERADRELTSELDLRDDRIRTAERAAALRDLGAAPGGLEGLIGVDPHWHERMMAACGRG